MGKFSERGGIFLQFFSWILVFYYYVFVVGNCTQILLTEGVERSSDEFSVDTIVEYRCIEGK